MEVYLECLHPATKVFFEAVGLVTAIILTGTITGQPLYWIGKRKRWEGPWEVNWFIGSMACGALTIGAALVLYAIYDAISCLFTI